MARIRASHHKRPVSRLARAWRTWRSHPFATPSLALVALLAVSLCAWYLAGTQGVQASGGPDGAGQTTNKQPWCGDTNLPDCPAATPEWVALEAETPGAAAQAIAKSPMFASIQRQHGQLSLDLPALVHPFNGGTAGGSDYWTNDHWVVSVRYPSAKQEGVFDYVYDRANHRIRFAFYVELGPSDPRYGHAFPYSQPGNALGRLKAERGLDVKAGTTPELVFYAIDAQYLNPEFAAQHGWSAGGQNPTYPVWHVVGADGHDYFVGNDAHVHDKANIPFAH